MGGIGIGVSPFFGTKGLKEAVEFYQRVAADSGSVYSNDRLYQLILMLKSQGLFDGTQAVFAPCIASKTRTSTIYKYLSKLYSIRLAANDATQTTEANQPFEVGNIAPNESKAAYINNNETRSFGHPEISYAANVAWSAVIFINNNGVMTTTNPILSNTGGNTVLYIKNTTNIVALKNESGTTVNGTATLYSQIGKWNVIHLVAAGDGTLKVYSNGSLLDTLSVATNVTFDTLTWKGFNGYVRLFTGEMSAGQITAEYNLLRSWIPEIEQVQIGSQIWQSSNLQAVATPVGNVISEVQAASAVEKIAAQDNRDFTNWANVTWVGHGGGVVSDGTGKMKVALNPSAPAGKSGAVLLLPATTIGRYYKVVIDLWKDTATHSLYFVQVGGALKNFVITGTQTTYTAYIKATSVQTLFFVLSNNNTTDSGTIFADNISVTELGWVNSTEIYDAVYAATAGTAAQKEYAALKEAAMWCNYNNDTTLGAVYGKLYNWYAAKLFDLDMATAGFGWHIPTSTEFTTLQTYLGGASVAGGKMKMTGTNHWESPNTGADNSSGFTSLGSGLRLESGNFSDFKNTTLFISSDAYYLRNKTTGTDTFLVNQSTLKHRGFSIRLIKV